MSQSLNAIVQIPVTGLADPSLSRILDLSSNLDESEPALRNLTSKRLVIHPSRGFSKRCWTIRTSKRCMQPPRHRLWLVANLVFYFKMTNSYIKIKNLNGMSKTAEVAVE